MIYLIYFQISSSIDIGRRESGNSYEPHLIRGLFPRRRIGPVFRSKVKQAVSRRGGLQLLATSFQNVPRCKLNLFKHPLSVTNFANWLFLIAGALV